MSDLSEKGGHANVGNVEFAATKPDSALERPAIVMYTNSFSFILLSNISNTFLGSLCAEAACCSHSIQYSSSLFVIFNE